MDRMADYTEEQAATIGRLEHDLGERMSARPQRLAHSLSVAYTAEEMALLYGVDAFQARVAGILHDWDKALTTEELKADAHAMGIDLGVDMSLVIPLLHGLTAARRLRSSYPELPEPVFAAIERHTMAAVEMAPLDQVLFVADGIEPLRGDAKGIREVRELVGVASLGELFWRSFVGGIVYVLETNRYLYPGTLEIYNALALRRAQGPTDLKGNL